MNSKSKTTEDLLREMREYADQLDNDGDITGADFRDFANQLEEAMKREKAVTDALLACKGKMTPHPDPDHAPPPYPGNAAALREALRTLRQRFDNNVMAYQDRYFKFSGWHWHKKAAEAARWRDVFHELREACDAALAAPSRNCDVGTAEEQEERFDEFCSSHFKHCSKCPLFDKFRFCQSAWMQMPYEKEGASK